MPGSILVYRNEGDRPFCEIALNSGERVQLQLDKAGLVITRDARDVLFKGDADLVTDICMAFVGKEPASRKTALDLLSSIVTQLPSADHVREAFTAAAKAV